MKFRCFDIVNTGEPAPAEVIIELDDDEIEDDLDEAIHEALFESGEIDGHLESFEFEPMN
ncbi:MULTISPECIES: hypothetical protein [Brevundimonas]|uniref:Uncharacterized protein n=2 Tax=Brevundimonas TaxID=41275 RepID=A0ABU4KMI2_BREVE|nr:MULTISPECIES: hypothetical protein [Brevundimonas]KIC59780.1 hypothetical protein RM53_05125 [Brevundimonas nasdae]MDX2334115.1 hypothetical protein [Brevundimonas vesicularis]